MLFVRRSLAAFAGLVAAEPAVAHVIAEQRHSAWQPDPWLLLTLAITAVLYILGWRRMGLRVRARLLGGSRPWSFAAGMAMLEAALVSPLDGLAHRLFSTHMLQHLLLMLVAPPLLAWGRPLVTGLWAFPLRVRRGIGRFRTGTPDLRPLIHLLTRPLAIGLAASFALWFWHLPGPYGWALRSRAVHILEHLSFFLTALAFWTLVIERGSRHRLGYGAALALVAVLGMQESLLGALLTFAAHPLYPIHGEHVAFLGLTPLEDQELAGLLMWVPASMVHLAMLSFLFLAWFDDAERWEIILLRASQPIGRHGLLMVSLLALIMAGCSGAENIEIPVFKVAGGNPQQAPALIRHYGCGTCHLIPGVEGAHGGIGPPWTQFANRAYIAGVLPNTPENLMHWIRNPQSVVPGNAMPEMGVTEQDARDIAAYLYTLR